MTVIACYIYFETEKLLSMAYGCHKSLWNCLPRSCPWPAYNSSMISAFLGNQTMYLPYRPNIRKMWMHNFHVFQSVGSQECSCPQYGVPCQKIVGNPWSNKMLVIVPITRNKHKVCIKNTTLAMYVYYCKLWFVNKLHSRNQTPTQCWPELNELLIYSKTKEGRVNRERQTFLS